MSKAWSEGFELLRFTPGNAGGAQQARLPRKAQAKGF
jgi:hypothetical protein